MARRLLIFLAGLNLAGAAWGIDSAGIEFFESKVRPILVERCYQCHSNSAPKLKAGLKLDSLDAMTHGGESGPALVPGKPQDSLLVTALQYDPDGLQMPPKGKLPPDQIQAIETWVKMGAPYPQAPPTPTSAPSSTPHRMTLPEGRDFWSFKRPTEPKVPEIKGGWNEIDRFVLAKLGEKGLQLSPESDRRTLIRRATYDLTGLPPTAEEVEAFEKDPSPNAYEKLIDRLLASPRYGERWGRHWLDVARYADTKGYVFQEERRYAFSYTYRDWVIRSLNEDLPYDQFLIQQIAADRLDLKEDKRPLAALGFLTLGRRFINNTHDIIDDRIDVVCRGTMALTVGCARCHDHKYDPIPTADYYSLYGVFASSTEPGELPLLGTAEKTPAFAEYEKELAKRTAAREDWIKNRAAEIAKAKGIKPEEARNQLDGADQLKIREFQNAIDLLIATHPGSPPRAMAMVDAPNPVTPHIFKRGNPGNAGPEVPRQFLAILSPDNRTPFKDGSGRLELAKAIASKENPLTARVMVNRVWQWHFGYGLVRTPSDFGTRGDRPTHPELLDWLALRFENEDGWSLKKLHKRIMMSAAYRQSSLGGNAKGMEVDPENKLLWRFNLQRMDFEEMRDSVLAASGQLDGAMGGRSVDIFTQPFTTRRSVYAFIDRQNLPGLFRTFDFASPDGHQGIRPITSVPQQALFMMNSPFIIEQARKVAERAAKVDGYQGVAAMYRVILGRAPTAEEVELGMKFVQAEQSAPMEVAEVKGTQWQYGYGEYDEGTGRMKSFTALPHFSGKAWQGGEKMPDQTLGWALLNETGGHPGNDKAHAVVRRWVAPRDCTVAVDGVLAHAQEQGDGVRGRLITPRDGTVGTWVVHQREVGTKVSAIAMKKGEAIDFVVDCGAVGRADYDQFTWKVTVTKVATPGAVAGEDNGTTWDSGGEFAGPAPKPAPPMNAWEKYAQVLMQSNEFMFVE